MLMLSALMACSNKPPRIFISRILINAPQIFDGADKERTLLRDHIRQTIEQEKQGRVEWSDRRSATHNLRLRVLPAISGATPSAPAAVQEWAVALILESVGDARSFQSVGRGGNTKDLSSIGIRGFNEAWALTQIMRQLEVADEDVLLEKLTADDRQTQAYAIDKLGRMASKRAVDPLLKMAMNREGRQELILKSIGALVAIGDERVVDPLIELTTRQEPGFVLQIVFAVSSLGGRTAEGFLLTMSEGHPNPRIQRGARDALKEMMARRKREKKRK